MDQVEQPHELKWRERKGVPKKGKAGGGKEKEEKGTGKKKRKEEEKGRIEFRRGGKETGSSTAGVEGEPRVLHHRGQGKRDHKIVALGSQVLGPASSRGMSHP